MKERQKKNQYNLIKSHTALKLRQRWKKKSIID